MVKCQNCGTNNRDNATECSQCQQPLTKTPATVIEQIPTWLIMLLAKYGEEAGRIVGLEEIPDPEVELRTDATEEFVVSSLLDNMADSDTSSLSDESFSSVEWGSPQADEGGIDNILSAMDVPVPHQRNPAPPHTQVPQQPQYPEAPQYDEPQYNEPSSIPGNYPPQYDEPVQDWMGDSYDPPPVAQPAYPPQPATPDETVPDWISDTFDPPQDIPMPTVELPPQSAIPDESVPDWISDTFDPPQDTPIPATPPPPSQQSAVPDEEVPDWLSQALDAPVPDTPIVQQPPTSPIAETDEALDWLADTTTPEITPTHSEAAPVTEDTNIPDWLNDPAPSVSTAAPRPTPDTSNVPDWLQESTSDYDNSFASPTTAAPTQPTGNAPDWLNEGLDDLNPIQVTPHTATSEPSTLDVLPPESLQPTEPQGELPSDQSNDWLSGLRAAVPDEATSDVSEPLTEQDEEVIDFTIPDWISNTPDSPVDEVAGAEPSDSPSIDETPTEIPDWLKSDDTSDAPLPDLPQTQSEMPDWLNDPAPAEPVADLPTEEAPTEIPDWLKSDDTSDAPLPDLPQTQSEMPDWLNDPAPAEPVADLPTEEVPTQIPDWLKSDDTPDAPLPDLPQTQSNLPVDDTPTQIPDWLKSDDTLDEPLPDLPQTQSEIPDWLNAPTPAEPVADLPVDDTPTTIPDWLKSDDTSDEPLSDLPQTQSEMPDWLNDPAPAEPVANLPTEEVPTEIPDWLKSDDTLDEPPSDASQVTEAQSPTSSNEDSSVWVDVTQIQEPPTNELGLTEPETPAADIPETDTSVPSQRRSGLSAKLTKKPTEQSESTHDWLSGLRQADSETEPPAKGQTDNLEWLTEASDVAESELSEPAKPDRVPVIEDDDTPEWLTNTPSITGPLKEEDMPDWLTALPQAQDLPTTADLQIPAWLEEAPESIDDALEETAAIEPETPDWLTDLPQAEDTSSGNEQPDIPIWLADMFPPEEDMPPLAETEPEAPAWLADLTSSDKPDETDSDTIEAEAPLDIPNWLTETPKDTEGSLTETGADISPETEMPAWLADVDDVEETQTEQELIPDPSSQQEDNNLDWMAGLRQQASVQPFEEPTIADTPSAQVEDEIEIPSWLTETDSPSTVSVVSEAEMPDTPDWLTDLPPDPHTGPLDASEPAAQETQADEASDLPSWLAETDETLTEPTVSEAEAPETPDWLTDLPQAPHTGPLDIPEPAAQENQADEDSDTPPWLVGTDESSPELAVSETEEPDTLDGLTEPDAPSPEPAVSEAGAPETPDWLTDLPQAPHTGPLDAPEPAVQETQADEASDLPPWLAETDAPSPEPAVSKTEEPDTPDWLTDLPQAPHTGPLDTPEPAVQETQADEASDLPPWLAETDETLTEPLTSEAEEPDTPDWLTDLPQAPHTGLLDTSEPAVQETQADEDSNLPPWLAETDAPSPEPAVSKTEEPDTPDWLTDLPQAPHTGLLDTPEPAPQETQTTKASDIPPWLAETDETLTEPLTSEATEPDTPDRLTDEGAELIEDKPDDGNDWLSSLRQRSSDEVLEETEAETSDDTPVWLLEDSSDIEAPASELESETNDTDWLKSLPSAAEVEATGIGISVGPTDESTDDIPDWLVNESPDDVVAEADTTEEGTVESDQEDEPDWLLNVPDQEHDHSPAPEPTPDVLVSDQADEEELHPEPEPIEDMPQSSEATPEDVPDWLTNLPDPDAEQPPSAEPNEIVASVTDDTPESSEEAGDNDEPLWMAGIRAAQDLYAQHVQQTGQLTTEPEAGETTAKPAELAEEKETDEAEVPAWLTDDIPEDSDQPSGALRWLQDDTSSPAEEVTTSNDLTETSEAVEEAVSDDDRVPDWLTPETSEADEPTPDWLASDPTVEVETPPETPSWLTASSPEPVTPSEDTYTSTVPDWLTDTADSEADTQIETPDWLSEQTPETPTTTTSEWLTEESPTDEVPDWLAVDTTQSEVETSPDDSSSQTIPDWLDTEPPAEQIDSSIAAELEKESDTPDWLTPDTPQSEAPISPADAPSETEATPSSEADEEAPPSWITNLQASEPTDAPEELGEESDTPDWLTPDTPQSEAPISPPAGAPSETEETPSSEADEEAPPSWITNLQASEPTEDSGTEFNEDVTEAPEIPSWLTVESGSDTTDTLSEHPDEIQAEAFESEPETPDWLKEDNETDLVSVDDSASTEIPDWLSGAAAEAGTDTTLAQEVDALSDEAQDEPAIPEWLSAPDTTTTPNTPEWLATDSNKDVASTSETKAPEAVPDWLTGLRDSAEDIPDSSTTDAFDSDSVASPALVPDEATALMTDSEATLASIPPPMTTPTEASTEDTDTLSPDWLETLQSPSGARGERSGVSETIQTMAGLGVLRPMEPKSSAGPNLDLFANAKTDTLQDAIEQFQTITTTAPQPLDIPEALPKSTRSGNLLRTILYLLFIILIALPLIPGVRATDFGREFSWSEPAEGNESDLLSRQRRELISEELGVIDLQQPGSVGLISVDFTTATQGEMMPLAEAIVGRLRGQGMRLIFISLEPEGAMLAQQLIEQRDEVYGEEMLNLGYVPGQVTGVRQIATGETVFSGLADFEEGLTFSDAVRIDWQAIENISDVDVVVTLTDNPTSGQWWVEQMALALEPTDGERFLLAGASATTSPFLHAYRDSDQLDGLLSGINGAAAVEAARRQIGPARQMLDSQSIAHLLIVILTSIATIRGWMPSINTDTQAKGTANTDSKDESLLAEEDG